MPARSRRRARAHTPSASPQGPPVPVEVERFVAGGVALGREADGRVVLVEGALPGEAVLVALSEQRPTMARGRAVELVRPVAGRVEAPCPEVAAGCGGCDLQHASPSLQRELKVQVVQDALSRLARLQDVPVVPGEVLPVSSYRSVLRCAVHDGRAGLHRRRSDRVHVLERCWVAHPAIDRVLSLGRFPGAEEVTIRVGVRTGDVLVVVTPTATAATVPDGVQLVGRDELERGASAWIHEVVGRRRFRISADSFFQGRPDGAEALVRAVGRAVAPFDPAKDRLVDLYGGVGLFSAGLGARRSVLVERSASSVGDARVNLAELATRIEHGDVERWSPEPADVVVADPARAGLGAAAVEVLAATGATRVALVSCDPAAMGRDVGLLVAAGYRPTGVELVDMFPHTHHLEAVTSLVRDDG